MVEDQVGFKLKSIFTPQYSSRADGLNGVLCYNSPMRSLLIFAYIFLTSTINTYAINASEGGSNQAGSWSGRCVGVGQASDVATIKGFECLFYNALQVVVYIAGVVFFAMLITGGFKYLFSSGDQKKVAAASSTLTMSIIGLVGVIVSYFILRFIQEFTGINVLQFKIGN